MFTASSQSCEICWLGFPHYVLFFTKIIAFLLWILLNWSKSNQNLHSPLWEGPSLRYRVRPLPPTQLGLAPAPPATPSAGEAMLGNGRTREFCPVLFLHFTPILCAMRCSPRDSRGRQTVSGPHTRLRVSKQHDLSIRMRNGSAAITWRGEAVGKQLCIFIWESGDFRNCCRLRLLFRSALWD